MTAPLSRALRVELRHLYQNGAGSGVSAAPAGDGAANLLEWRATIAGVEGTVWAGRAVTCRLHFCPVICSGAWPSVPPKLVVCHPLPHHPNVDRRTGAVCMDLLQHEWSCAGGVLAVLLSFRSLLAGPNISDAGSMPANLDAAEDFLMRPDTYYAKNAKLAMQMPRCELV